MNKRTENHKKKICIITPGYAASSPRVIKEADALCGAGFGVKVIFSQGNSEEIRGFDNALLKEKPWEWNSLGWSSLRKSEKGLYLKTGIRHMLYRNLPSPFSSFLKLAVYGEGRLYKELFQLAIKEKTDMYIGHYPTGLAVAYYAAKCTGAKLGYDAEDLHTQESPPNSKRQMIRIKSIEKHFLPSCPHITTTSEHIAWEIAKQYNIARPIVIHNVFPWRERESIDGKIKDRKGSDYSLYWYSQVIGKDRGIQDAIMAVGLLKEKVELHLRGHITNDAKKLLLFLAKKCNIEKRLYFHPQIEPKELLSRASEHDIGLALEQPINLSRQLSVTNKFFFYMLAGLAIAATNIPGQKHIMSSCPDAGFTYAPGDYRSLANNISELLSYPEKLKACKDAALLAAQKEWNWEIESQKLIKHISGVMKE